MRLSTDSIRHLCQDSGLLGGGSRYTAWMERFHAPATIVLPRQNLGGGSRFGQTALSRRDRLDANAAAKIDGEAIPDAVYVGRGADTTRRGPSVCHTVTITIRILVCDWPQSDAEAPSLLRLSKNNQILQCIDHAFQ